MTTEFELEHGRDRALVVYYSGEYGVDELKDAVDAVFEQLGAEYDEASDATLYRFAETKNAANIALEYNNVAKRLKVGGQFETVCVGVFFYDEPTPPDQSEPEIAFIPSDELVNPIGEPEYEEPEPAPSITELVCDALRETFGGVYGASAFVIQDNVTSYILEVE